MCVNWLIHQSVSWCLGAHLLSSTVPYHTAITRIACQDHVNPVLVAAVIERESQFNSHKFRRERRIHDISRGLMQVTLRTARWLGFRGAPQTLYNPWVNIRYGTKYLAYLLKRYTNVSDVLAAYNDGRPRKRHGRYVSSSGSFSVDHYVRAILSNTRALILTADAERLRQPPRSSEGNGLLASGFPVSGGGQYDFPTTGLFNRVEMGF